MRRCLIGLMLLLALAPLRAATLQMLSINDMIQLSTYIVRGKVLGTSASFKGNVIYTHYQVRVVEEFKGPAVQQIDVAVPGGTSQGYRQTFSGTPLLNTGDEYLFFLWTSKTGTTQILGLSQGLFTITKDANGQISISRAASNEVMVSSSGKQVQDRAVTLRLSDLVALITGNAGRSK